MTQNPNQNQPNRRSPQQIATAVGVHVCALVRIVFWAVIAVAILAFGFVALTAIWFAAQIILQAVGLN